ncbi:hypothetical protein QQX98_002323 [Neonectria punicea]|uniref:C2H2-type domain-containing protein n=1 Tax=Neonectria punicea TaxID=979145 RepID=A0ABR1HJ22_9HYPO
MLPFHQQSSDPNPEVTETPDGSAGPANTATHKRPSLRILNEGPTTLEEDLFHGPSLRCLGIGVGPHEYEVIHSAPGLDLEPIFEGSHRPEVSREAIPSSVPLAFSNVPPPQSMSLSELSDTGRSLSLPTDGLSSTMPSQYHEIVDSETQGTQSTSDGGVLGPILRNLEFSWENSGLLFGGEPFDVSRAAATQSCKSSFNSKSRSTTPSPSHPGSQGRLFEGREPHHAFVSGEGLLGIGGSTESWVASGLADRLEIASPAFSVSSTASRSESISERDLSIQAPVSIQAAIAQDQDIDRIAGLLLDDYVRSYAPQRTRKRNTRNRGAHQVGCDPGKKADTNSNSAKRTRRRPSRKTVNGSRDSEDEDSRDGVQCSVGTTRFKDSRRLACPFLKWNTAWYKETCWVKLTRMSLVKDHLRKKHYKPYCARCYMKDHTPDHLCIPKPSAPVSLITLDKLKAINERTARNGTLEEKWQRLYAVLFPDEPVCVDPFLSDHASQMMQNAEHYYEFGGGRERLLDGLKDLGSQGLELRDQGLVEVCKFIYERWLSQVLIMCTSGGEAHSTDGVLGELPRDDDQAGEPAYPDLVLDPNAVDPNSPALGLNGNFALMPEALSIAGVNGWEPENIAGTEEVGHTGLENDTLGAPMNSFGLRTVDEFSRLLLSGEDEAYETGYAGASLGWNI